jgi:kumamolisin
MMLAVAPLTSAFGRELAHPIPGDVPEVVAQGKARALGHHDPNAVFRVNVDLGFRNSDALDQLIQAITTPGDPQYGHYLTLAQFHARFSPTDAAVAAVKQWVEQQGLDVIDVTSDNVIVHVRGKIGRLEQAFGVKINDYRSNGRSFYSNDRAPSVPSDLGVSWVAGLSDHDRATAAPISPNLTKGSFDGGDFRKAYDVTESGSGLTIGFALWGRALPQSEYDGYAAATGTTALTIGQAGDDGLDFVAVDGETTDESDNDGEIAMDTEVAHALAPGAHETYFLGDNNFFTTIEDVENAAANSNVKIISNSWGCDGCIVDFGLILMIDEGVATGKTFVFSSGDNGASVGRSEPAILGIVLAVGGTTLNLDKSSNWSSETAWSGSGGGCDDDQGRPPWQAGILGTFTWDTPPTACSGRAEPDVAADADPATCAFVFIDGDACIGGTSLSAPLWSAMLTLWNGNNAANGRPGVGFVPPLIYALANDPATYHRDFHDITSGSNGFSAGIGWDEVTGWGSPIFQQLSNNVPTVTYTGPTQVNKGDTIALSGSVLDTGVPLATAALGAQKLSFAAAGSSCDASTSGGSAGDGSASCSVTINDNPGKYKAIAAYAGDAAYTGGSQTVDFTVLHIPTTIVYTGPTSGDYNDPLTLSAKLIDNSGPGSFSHLAPIPNETLTFILGQESCSATTNASGVASCSVTPSSRLDVPGSYSLVVQFGGDGPVYNSSGSLGPFTLGKEESKLDYTGPTTSHYHDPVTVSATLTDPDGGAPIPAKVVAFTLGAAGSCIGITDGSGVASCSINPSQTGPQTLTVSFGDVYYVSSNASRSFSITPEETTMAYTGPTVILAGAAGATLTARLVEDGTGDTDGDGGSPAPVPAETVTLSLASQSCTGMTNPTSGDVTCTIQSVSVPLGPEAVGASFAGDASYQKSSASTTAIVFAFPSSGAFTLGDLTVASATPTTTVTWWNNNWYSLNSLSGGTPPPPFKGFVSVVTLPSTTPAGFCTMPWSTSGGNSQPPPASVPSYMGVVVAPSITKTGNTLSGNYVKIVVVKTDPGYAPGPENSGSGKVVATYCP